MIQRENQILSAYIDGTLPPESQDEFDQIIRSNPKLMAEVEGKRTQANQVKTLIPKTNLSKDVRENLEREIKNTLDQFIIEEKEGFWQRVFGKFSR